jgi:hypothetical protein
VRDLAGWLLTAARARLSGPVNVVGESARLGALWDLCAEASESPARWEPASEAFLLDQGVEPWSGPRSLPMWLPAADSGFFGATPDGRALRAALQRRPLVNTIVDVLADERDRGLDRPRRAGLTRPEESALLALLTA